jgi:hypothetical protein
MEIKIDESFNKVVTLPIEFASSNPKKYEHLHTTTFFQYLNSDLIEEVEIDFVIDEARGIVFIYKDVLTPNLYFAFSQNFNFDRFETDERYKLNCQFFYWEDQNGPHIRFASPHLDIIKEVPLFS